MQVSNASLWTLPRDNLITQMMMLILVQPQLCVPVSVLDFLLDRNTDRKPGMKHHWWISKIWSQLFEVLCTWMNVFCRMVSVFAIFLCMVNGELEIKMKKIGKSLIMQLILFVVMFNAIFDYGRNSTRNHFRNQGSGKVRKDVFADVFNCQVSYLYFLWP